MTGSVSLVFGRGFAVYAARRGCCIHALLRRAIMRSCFLFLRMPSMTHCSKNCWADREGGPSSGSSHTSRPLRHSKLIPIPHYCSCCSQHFCKCRKEFELLENSTSQLSTTAAAAPCAATNSVAGPHAAAGRWLCGPGYSQATCRRPQQPPGAQMRRGPDGARASGAPTAAAARGR